MGTRKKNKKNVLSIPLTTPTYINQRGYGKGNSKRISGRLHPQRMCRAASSHTMPGVVATMAPNFQHAVSDGRFHYQRVVSEILPLVATKTKTTSQWLNNEDYPL